MIFFYPVKRSLTFAFGQYCSEKLLGDKIRNIGNVDRDGDDGQE